MTRLRQTTSAFRESILPNGPRPSLSMQRPVPSPSPPHRRRSSCDQIDQVRPENGCLANRRPHLSRICLIEEEENFWTPLSGGMWPGSSACILIRISEGEKRNPDLALSAARATVGMRLTRGRGETRCRASMTPLREALSSQTPSQWPLETVEGSKRLRRLRSPYYLRTPGLVRQTVRVTMTRTISRGRERRRRLCGRRKRRPF